MTTNPALAYIDAAQAIIEHIKTTQLDAIDRAAEVCANAIAQDGLVHLFGSGHSRIPVEEMFPRYGSFPGFHPIVELSLTFHNQVVGANGQRQAILIEKMEGLGDAILRNFIFRPYDAFIVFSNSGVNNVIMEIALGAKARGMTLIGVVSVDQTAHSDAKHKSGQKLADVCDIVIDNGAPAGDALVQIEGMEYPVAPGSTVGYTIVVNALKAAIADKLTKLGKPPLVLTNSAICGAEKSAALFEQTYDDYRARIAKVYGG
ncbi:MAG: SIS domain-containing protein [Chloroflexota bacterium]|nr:SIS domain-containing protein [Chloroflexota bacterium]